jgi:alcohol dehydrogenase
MACLDPKAAARIAILDPTLTLSQPLRVTACTGIDALAHALETAVTKKRNPLSAMFSREAFRLCVTALPEVLLAPKNLEARGRMLLGAALAGLAIENSMLGAAHAAANPLTAHYGVVHGQAVGLMLPAVIRFNAADPECRRAYAELASVSETSSAHDGDAHTCEELAARVDALLGLAHMPRSLVECGVERSAVPTLADEAARQWTATFNPRPVTKEDFAKLYEDAFKRRPVPVA